MWIIRSLRYLTIDMDDFQVLFVFIRVHHKKPPQTFPKITLLKSYWLLKLKQ